MCLGVKAPLPEHRGCWKRHDAWALFHPHPTSTSALLCALRGTLFTIHHPSCPAPWLPIGSDPGNISGRSEGGQRTGRGWLSPQLAPCRVVVLTEAVILWRDIPWRAPPSTLPALAVPRLTSRPRSGNDCHCYLPLSAPLSPAHPICVTSPFTKPWSVVMCFLPQPWLPQHLSEDWDNIPKRKGGQVPGSPKLQKPTILFPLPQSTNGKQETVYSWFPTEIHYFSLLFCCGLHIIWTVFTYTHTHTMGALSFSREMLSSLPEC